MIKIIPVTTPIINPFLNNELNKVADQETISHEEKDNENEK